MLAIAAWVAGAAGLVSSLPLRLAAQEADLRARLEQRIAASGATVGLYFHDLTRPDSLLLGADTRFHAASTMKIAVMIQVFRDVDSGRIRLEDRLSVVNTFTSIADGSSYALDRKDDSDSSLYERVGERVSVRDLLRLMITVSSNLATNTLMRHVGAARVQATVRGLGADSMVLLRGVEDGAAFRAGLNNSTTARDLGVLLAAIADGRAASPNGCGAMLDILLHQRFNEAIPAGLPPGTRVAHKTGMITALKHDAAIVYVRGRPRYVLVILTRGLADEHAADRLIADLARMVHEAAVAGGGR